MRRPPLKNDSWRRSQSLPATRDCSGVSLQTYLLASLSSSHYLQYTTVRFGIVTSVCSLLALQSDIWQSHATGPRCWTVVIMDDILFYFNNFNCRQFMKSLVCQRKCELQLYVYWMKSVRAWTYVDIITSRWWATVQWQLCNTTNSQWGILNCTLLHKESTLNWSTLNNLFFVSNLFWFTISE